MTCCLHIATQMTAAGLFKEARQLSPFDQALIIDSVVRLDRPYAPRNLQACHLLTS
jgi:hypothetical protein